MISINQDGRYSAVEIRDIAISVFVLSIAFAVALNYRSDLGFPTLIAISAVVVCLSFVAHELAHKFVAQRYGAWAEYRMFPMGLIIALIISFSGFIFASPGAVYIGGSIDDEENGKISAAGPAVNIVLGAVAFILALYTTGIIGTTLWIMASINAFFAVFNMIPISPFDGSKILGWNIAVYLAMAACAAALLITIWFL
ncbi:MAG: site-2 protease family protein [Methanomassiliicoccaceae archaeon]|jgi:Zn-dependent protease|nr:site-2 protease family protein [Methanomassiliicoccaceae archaeon]